MPKKPKIGIVGKGNMGTAFAEGFAKAGYVVEPAGRDPEEVRTISGRSEIVIVAVPYSAVPALIPVLAPAVHGKIVVDITNLLGPNYTFVGDPDRSGAERLQDALPGARVVKAFNTVFSAYLNGGKIRGETLTAFVAGDDAAAKAAVLDLARDLGLEAVDAGGLRVATWLEALGYFNIVVHDTIGWDHGFRLVREHAP